MILNHQNIAKLVFISAIIVSLMTISAKGQIVKTQKSVPKGVTLVFCNERDSLKDQLSFPNDAVTFNGRQFLSSHYFISEGKGSYNYSLRSKYNFNVLVRQKIGTNGKWATFKTSTNRASLVRSEGIEPYYFWNYLSLKQTGFESNHNEFGLIITPSVGNQSVAATWYTSNCEKSKPVPTTTDKSCRWVSGGIFGVSYECRCGGVLAKDPKVCGKRP